VLPLVLAQQTQAEAEAEAEAETEALLTVLTSLQQAAPAAVN